MPDPFTSLFRATERSLAALARQATAGRLTPASFADRVADTLEHAHTQAVVLGRHRAGDRAPLEADDREFAAQVVDGEAEFLAAFQRDIEAGRYAELPDAVVRRARQYAGRLVGTANEALALVSEVDVWEWRLGSSRETCPDCLHLALGGPYKRQELPTWPGMNGTRCLFNCRCAVVRADGVEGFALPE